VHVKESPVVVVVVVCVVQVAAVRMGVKKNAYRILVGKSEGKRSLGRQRRRLLDNIKMDL
jgi:hypothetical protein